MRKEEYEEEREEEENPALVSALQQELGALSWYGSSTFVHVIILLILLLLPVPVDAVTQPTIIINPEIITEQPPKPKDTPIDREPKEPDPVETDIITKDPLVIKTTKIEISDKFETDDDMDQNTALGDLDCISDVDSEYQGTPALLGVGSTGGKGGGGKFGHRYGGGKKNTVRMGGGSPETQRTVDAGLEWLAYHQEADGHWDCGKYQGKNGQTFDTAVTSLALLAFLGNGNSCDAGRYKQNVRRATDWLVKEVKESGEITAHRYTTAIATMALAEAYGMGDYSIKNVAQKAVDWCVKTQCPTGGWDYAPNNAKRVDTSVSGWFVMALKSAIVAELTVPSEVMENALKYFEQATTDNDSTDGLATTSYSSQTGELQNVKRGGNRPAMTAVGLTSFMFLGKDRMNGQVLGTANKLMEFIPQVNGLDYYRVYYQCLGLFQMGIRSHYWKTFVKPFADTMIASQIKEGTVEQLKGSFNPDTHHMKLGGRVMSTAIGCLCLEVFYRYKEVAKH